MTKWLGITILGALMGSGVLAADLNAGRDVAQRLLAESRAAREQAAAAAALLRKGNDLSGLGAGRRRLRRVRSRFAAS